MNPCRVSASVLRTASRTPPVPVELLLDDGRSLVLKKLLRILPGKRITGIAYLDDKPVVAKLFIARHGCKRHWQREQHGTQRLLDCGLPTPPQFSAGKLHAGGYYVLKEFIEDAKNPSELLKNHSNECLSKIFATIGRMHAHGLIHQDAHLGNFLLKKDQVFVLDGDAVHHASSPVDGIKNLALLLAQLPPKIICQENLLTVYQQENPGAIIDRNHLELSVSKARQKRLHDYLKKCLRDCSQFQVTRKFGRFVSMLRDEAEYLLPIIADPDGWLKTGRPLKAGRTATLATVTHSGRELVIKRYNIKNPRHALSRCWRPSRAWHSWVAAHRLEFLGITTPRPLAMIEKRCGPFRREAWLIMEHCHGVSLTDYLSPHGGKPPTLLLENIQVAFQQLADANITHGDLKASNLLCHKDQIFLIDLDAMKQHASTSGFRRAWEKDRQRFLHNWPLTSPLHRIFDALTKTI